MKIILSEEQIKLLAENQLGYTEENLQNFFNKGVNYLEQIRKIKEESTNQVIMTSISDILEDEEKYLNLKQNLDRYVKNADILFNKLYNVVEMYDISDRPEIVSKLEYDVTNKIEDAKNKIESLSYVLESLLDSANEVKEILNS